MLRVYLDGERQIESRQPAEEAYDQTSTSDRGDFVAGVRIPDGREVVRVTKRLLGRWDWLCRVDIKTCQAQDASPN